MPANPLIEQALESAAKGDLRPMRLRTSIESWAEKNGETPKHTVESWFEKHPYLVGEVVAARSNGWARAQILRWLQDEHAYPLRDDEAIERVGR